MGGTAPKVKGLTDDAVMNNRGIFGKMTVSYVYMEFLDETR